jgi:hypothetical protein
MFFDNGNMFPQSYERGPGGRAVGMGPSGVEHVGELGFVCRLVVLDAVAYRKSEGKIPATAEMLPIPKQAGDTGIINGEDVRAMVRAQGLAEIGAGDCVALHTGMGNSWSNDRYKTMTSEQRKAARDPTLHGRLSVDNDRAAIDRLWNRYVAAWYESGKDDPKLALLRLDAERAEIWLDEYSLVAGVKMILGIDPKEDYRDKVAEVKLT